MIGGDGWWHSPQMVTVLWGVISTLGAFATYQHRRITEFEKKLEAMGIKYEPIYQWFISRITRRKL